MRYDSLKDFLNRGGKILAKGPIALIFAEDEVELASTLRHHLTSGFGAVIAFMPDAFAIDDTLAAQVHRVDLDTLAPDMLTDTVNALIAAAPGTWFYYCYNAEYLFYPFCESRSVAEMLAFHAEERRDAMLCYVIDLYAGDLDAHPLAVSIEDAYLDKSGYYALARNDPDNHNHPRERQLDFFGGLRWRYEEHVPAPRRKIDRIALFRAAPGLELRADHTFNDQEYNTYACPWHHNITAAVCSFRTAKALKANPGSTFDIHNFRWHNSTPFEWHSRQLLDLGLMEPGQWF
ncbi:MAG: glycosyltransferase family 2 protein [Rhodobacterales bacterium]|nr:glycosyltransferase family 2 protein [Rhodobacterales bacterium]MDX5390168.1 glycosyltransferase family 2 protein [Rhodobacterales bacterium]MDX5489856.1 glycosyltransferase family 2 protein [Rhodobacterales bacterium]